MKSLKLQHLVCKKKITVCLLGWRCVLSLFLPSSKSFGSLLVSLLASHFPSGSMSFSSCLSLSLCHPHSRTRGFVLINLPRTGSLSLSLFAAFSLSLSLLLPLSFSLSLSLRWPILAAKSWRTSDWKIRNRMQLHRRGSLLGLARFPISRMLLPSWKM